jgi:hypothetical protein
MPTHGGRGVGGKFSGREGGIESVNDDDGDDDEMVNFLFFTQWHLESLRVT